MSTTSQTESSQPNPFPHPRRPSRWRYALAGLGVFALTIALLYTEENWRGKRAWEQCKRELEAKGRRLDWSAYSPPPDLQFNPTPPPRTWQLDWPAYVPPPVPDDQNIFKAPKMQEWFVGKGTNDLTQRLAKVYASADTPLAVAQLTIVPTTANPPGEPGAVVFLLDSPGTRGQVNELIRKAIGPSCAGAIGMLIVAPPANRIKPIQIVLQSQTTPAVKDIAQLFPKPTGSTVTDFQVTASGSNRFEVTLNQYFLADTLLARIEQHQSDFQIIRAALQRPYARMDGDYDRPFDHPIPNFVAIRIVAQTLAQRAQCSLLLGQPETALDSLTLIRQMSRLLEGRPTGKPMTLVAAMINVAVAGLYESVIADGIRLQAWHGAQLESLETQLKEVNLRPLVVGAFANGELPAVCHTFETASPTELSKIFKFSSGKPATEPKFSWLSLVPRGWIDQNLVVYANLMEEQIEAMDAANHLVVPHKTEEAILKIDATVRRVSPFRYIAAIAVPNIARATKVTARNQTAINQASVVCALERYRADYGGYPEALDALVPKFIDKIPNDLIGGQPPHYRRTSDGKFLFYSMGWSEQDHGGITGKDDQPGDWVWPED